jgi:hypothetical protein
MDPYSFSDPNDDLEGLLDELRSLTEQLTNVPRGQLSLTYVFRHTIYLQLLHIMLSRQIKTVLGDLQRVDERNIVELGDSGEHLSYPVR